MRMTSVATAGKWCKNTTSQVC